LLTLQSLNVLTNLLMQFKSLLRLDNKLYLWINSEKNRIEKESEYDFEKCFFLVFQRYEIAESLWLIKVCGIGFCLYWFQIIFCNKYNPCTLWNKYSFMCLLRLVVCSWGDQDQQSWCWCVGQEECVSWGVLGHSLGCCVSDQVVIA